MTPHEMTNSHVLKNINVLLNSFRNLTDEWLELFYKNDEREIYEYWLVSDWLAEQLSNKGEIIETNFYGLCVWGRTTTGQAVKMDSVIQEIANECRL